MIVLGKKLKDSLRIIDLEHQGNPRGAFGASKAVKMETVERTDYKSNSAVTM